MREDRSVRLARSAGVLLHPTSLPAGRLDREAYRFVDWLAAAGQSWWQMLPLGPPDEFGSPYRSPSAFAASPALLAKPDARVTAAEIEDFVARHAYWTGTGRLRRRRGDRRPGALRAGVGSAARVRRRARRPAHRRRADLRLRRGRRLAGWPELFATGEVAGAPPDALSANGQLWGNPLYDWPAHRATGYRWWRERFRRTFELVDLCRVDHFRGFVSYWAIPARAQDREARPLAARAGPRAVPRGRARARRAAADRRGPRRDHAARLPAARRARPAGHGGPPVGFRRLTRATRTGRRTTSATRSSTRARTTPTRVAGFFGGEPVAVGADRDRVPLARVARDRPGAGRARARQRGADEPPRHRDGQLAVAARARPAHAGARATPAPARGERTAARPRSRSRRRCPRRGSRSRTASASASRSTA